MKLISVSEKLKAFKAKLRLYKGKIEQGKTVSFPFLNLFWKMKKTPHFWT